MRTDLLFKICCFKQKCILQEEAIDRVDGIEIPVCIYFLCSFVIKKTSKSVLWKKPGSVEVKINGRQNSSYSCLEKYCFLGLKLRFHQSSLCHRAQKVLWLEIKFCLNWAWYWRPKTVTLFRNSGFCSQFNGWVLKQNMNYCVSVEALGGRFGF